MTKESICGVMKHGYCGPSTTTQENGDIRDWSYLEQVMSIESVSSIPDTDLKNGKQQSCMNVLCKYKIHV